MTIGCRLSALGLIALGACSSAPQQVRAQVIGSLEETIGGPHAIGTIGDILLENDKVRLIVSKPGPGRVNTTYGGSLVDADLVRVGGENAHGNDQLAELLPGFGFTVIAATSVTVTHDGSAGDYAEVTVTGGGGDLLEMVYLLNNGLIFPETLEFTNTYRLYPGKQYVEITSTVTNKGNGAHPFPYLMPQDLKDAGFDIPGVENLPALSAPMGQLPLFGGEQQFFTPGVAGFNVEYAIQDTYPHAGGFPAFPGMAVDFVASRGPGVSYGLAVPKSDANYINKYATGYPGQTLTPYSMLMPFTYAGVSAVYMYEPPSVLQPNEQFSYTSYFVIGKGDVASVADVIYDLRQQPTGTFGGQIVDAQTSAPVTDANVLVLDASGNPVDQIGTDSTGQFLAHLPPGSYSYVVLADTRVTTKPQPITITAGQQTGVFVPFDPPATISISVLDEQSRKAPVKVQLIGSYPPPPSGTPLLPCATQQCPDPRTFLYSLTLGERKRPTAFDTSNRFVEQAWWTKDGKIQATVRPGHYDLVVSRGPEYEVTTVPVDLAPGEFAAQNLRITPAFKSDGWVAGDFHIHAAPSTDSGLPIDERVISCAAEGLEVAVATDHNYITDYAPVIASSGLDPWLLGVPGMEMTTFEMGHFNGYPLKVDAGSTRGGEFEWAHKTPGDIFSQIRTLSTDGKGIVQVNHPRQAVLGYFAQFFVDSATAEPYTPTGILGIFAPYGDEFKPENYSQDFDALELVTGRRLEDTHTFVWPNPIPPGQPDPQPIPGTVVLGKDGRPTFPGTIETWMIMLNRGHVVTGMGTSDSHHKLGDEPGYARTMLFVGAGRDIPGGFSRDDVVAAIRGHHAIATNAPFLDMHVGTSMIGDTAKGATTGADVKIHVAAPSWGRANRLVVYANGAVVYDMPIPIASGAPQSQSYDTTVHVDTPKDTWVVAEVYGTDNMFPVLSPTEFPPLDATVIIKALSSGLDLSSLPITGAVKPVPTHFSKPFAITNPIWIDVDGGGFTPPMPALRKDTVTKSPPTPDVRAQFDSLPEVSP